VPVALAALQSHLFDDAATPGVPDDGSVRLQSWPGEARECVEIARHIQEEAARGTPFDRMAIFLRAPFEYRPHLEEALRRADVPAFFARGATRPDPAGRALLALLACAGEGLSARRFAEYLSLGQVPDPADPRDAARGLRGGGAVAAPAQDLLPEPAAHRRGEGLGPRLTPPALDAPRDPDAATVIDGSPRAPWRWEQLLVDASVIGSRERWVERLEGLEAELTLRRRDLDDEVDASLAAYLDRQIRDLRHLRETALPLIERLAALPSLASWGDWLDQLRGLAIAALRAPERVLEVLEEIAPMAPVGPVDLDEVVIVLAPRLRELTARPPRRRYGAVYIAPAECAVGLGFDVVFVPGLAEKLFPRKIVEDPLLLDARRAALSPELSTQKARTDTERLALRLAVGAASRRVFLSYPRVDLEKGRPRVPSFYGLEALKAVEGRLPGFEELRRRAEQGSEARLGWPAPDDPRDAIDEAEYDLALLAPLLNADPEDDGGDGDVPARLERAPRARAARTCAPVAQAVDARGRARRSGRRGHGRARAPSDDGALLFADGAPALRGLPVPLLPAGRPPSEASRRAGGDRGAGSADEGGLFHEAQYEILTELRTLGLLPVRPENLDRRSRSRTRSSPPSPASTARRSIPRSRASGTTASPRWARTCASGSASRPSPTKDGCRTGSSSRSV
jgi:hypothetical protein